MPTTRIGYVQPRGWQTLDEIIAVNVKRLREDKDWSISRLAETLGVRRHVAYDMEGARNDRAQREFKWSDLVELCWALETTLFDLVLPPEGVKVAGLEKLSGMIHDPEVKPLPPFESVGRKALAIHVFGFTKEFLSSDRLSELTGIAKEVRAEHDARVQEAASHYINEIRSVVDEALREGEKETVMLDSYPPVESIVIRRPETTDADPDVEDE